MRALFCAAVVILTLVSTSQAVSIVGDLGDGLVDVGGLSGSETAPTVRPGTGGNDSRGQAAIFFFALPTVPSPSSIVAADLDLTYLGIDGEVPEFNVDLFGIGSRASATIAASDYYGGDSALSMDALIKDNYITAATANGGLALDAPSTANLLAFIQSLYNANGTPTAAFAVFRANPDADLPPNSPPLRGFLLATADNVDNNGTMVPRLELTVVPEPSSAALTAVAITLVLRFPRKGSQRNKTAGDLGRG